MARLTLALLGGFAATVDGTPVTGFDTNKTRALLAYLGVETARPHVREVLAALLWPELPEEAARRNLRNSLFKLRQALGEEDGPPGWLLVTPQTVQIDPAGAVAVDVTTFARLLAACAAHRHRHVERCATCHARLQQAAALYQGDFLRGFHLGDCAAFEEWLVLTRERLHRAAVQVLGRLATYHEGRAEHAPALEYSFRQLELEPWREAAHRQAIRLLALHGQRGAALAQYAICRNVLAAELNAEPDAETTALYARLKAPARPAPGPQPPPAAPPPLPQPLTPFIGREAELRLLAERLDSLDYRVITVVGPGGVGKTRLALQAAGAQVGAFADGVYWVALAAVGSPDLLPARIAQALGFHFESAENPSTQLGNYLHDKELLLVLDNFEQLQGDGAATDLLLALLRRARRITLLLTSRERLGLHAEFLLDLVGLPLPPAPGPRAGRRAPPADELMASSAVQLFVERARRAHPAFTLSPETAPGVVEICRLVGGLPLGIVLAAAWVRHLPPARIAASIRANLDFLTSSARDAAPQHSSLRAVFQHSWNLLPAAEQRVFRGLAVFRKGWDEAAAGRVAGAALAELVSLVDKSLLRQDSAGRFEVHEMLRQYAAEQLQAQPEEQARVRQAHAQYYLDLAESAEAGLQSDAQDQWLARLEQEHDNLRAALRWGQEHGYVAWGLRLAAALSRFWWIRGYYGEGRETLAALLALPEGAAQDRGRVQAGRAKALQGAGDLARAQGDYPGARPLYEESLALYRALGNKQDIAIALNRRAIVEFNAGDHARAGRLYQESLALSREAGNQREVALALGNLGLLSFMEADYPSARILLEEAVALTKQLGNKFHIAVRLNNLGNVALMQGDHAAARAWHQEALALRRELGDQWGIAVCLVGLGGAALGAGQPEQGTRLLGAAEALLEVIGVILEPDDRIPYEHSIGFARARLGEATFERCRQEGRGLSMEQAVADALEER